MQQSAPITLAAAVMVWVLAAENTRAADESPIAWLSGEALRRQLDRPVSISWSGVPLREALQKLARSQRVAILLDRRVDPEQEVEMSMADIPLEEALQSIAVKLTLGVGRAGPVIYLGPPATAERLRTLVELRKQEIGRLPPAVRSALLAQKRCKWEMLSSPRELLAEAAHDYRIRIEPLAGVPHDLWPAADLPAVGLAERVSLIAAQFDLTFELADAGRLLRLTPMPDRVAIEKSYSHANPSLAISRLKAVLKNSQLEAGDKKFIVRGPAEEHELVDAFVSGKSVRQSTVTQGKKVYQLDIVMPAARLINQLGPKLDLNIEVDYEAIERAGLNLDKDVKVSVKNASEDELLKAVLDPAGLTFERAGKTLIVRPKDARSRKN